MKYRKKPVVIDALKWEYTNTRDMYNFLEGTENELVNKSNGKHFYIDHAKIKGGLVLKTLEGEHVASIGDFIIKGIKGEFYPCKPDIFEATYDKL